MANMHKKYRRQDKDGSVMTAHYSTRQMCQQKPYIVAIVTLHNRRARDSRRCEPFVKLCEVTERLYAGALYNNIGLICKWSYVTASPSRHYLATPILSPVYLCMFGHPYISLLKFEEITCLASFLTCCTRWADYIGLVN